MSALNLTCLKDMELDFLEEFRHTLAPIAVAQNRLPGEKTVYYAELLPNLLKISNKLANLQSVNFCHCTSLLIAVIAGFHQRFEHFQHSLLINKVDWSLLTATARVLSLALPNACEQSKTDDTEDDYFASAAPNDTEASQFVDDSMNKCDIEVLHYPEEKIKGCDSSSQLSYSQNDCLFSSTLLCHNQHLWRGCIVTPEWSQNLTDDLCQTRLLNSSCCSRTTNKLKKTKCKR